jgi:tellurite resistance protein
MFLAELQPEEKNAFLELAALMAKIDGNYSIYENPIMNEYIKEMEIEDYAIRGLAINEILEVFKNERTKNIVLSEILRLIFSDGVFHDLERESVHFIKKYFGFDSNEYDSFKNWVLKIKELANYPQN